jgi:hypothetical protein
MSLQWYMQRSELVSTRNCHSLIMLVMKRRRYVQPLISAALVSLLAVGTGWSKLLRSGSAAAIVPAVGGWSIISGGGSVAQTAVPGVRAGIPRFRARFPGAEPRVPEAGVKTVLLRGHMAELDLLAPDAGQDKLRLGLGKPHGWLLGPERWEPHGHSVGTSAGRELSAVSILLLGHRCGMSMLEGGTM